MTYCRGEGDCHGPTGTEAAGIDGLGGVCVCVWACMHAYVCFLKIERANVHRDESISPNNNY